METVDQSIQNANVDANANTDQFLSNPDQHINNEAIMRAPSRSQNSPASEHTTEPEFESENTALVWTRTLESQHSRTVGTTSKSRQSKSSLPPMGAGKPYPPDLPAQEIYLVDFDGAGDPIHPQNWSMNLRLVSVRPVQ
jgi:MFS transporter, DHA1 family, multidrug resistance protein